MRRRVVVWHDTPEEAPCSVSSCTLRYCCVLPALALAQDPVVKSNMVTKTVTITGIDHTARLVMFKTAEGQEDTVQVGPTVTRFNELKVGDSVTFSTTSRSCSS